MDKAKKYTIIFVFLCFFIIGGVSVYNATVPINKEKPIEIKKEDNKEVEKKEEVIEDVPKNETKPDEVVKPSQVETKKEEPKTESKKPIVDSKVEEITKIKVNVSIKGIDSIMTQGEVEILPDQTVYDALKAITNSKGIQLNTNGSGRLVYIRGINGLNEFDHGSQSGWTYYVNGVFPNKGAGLYKLKAGDQVEWRYSINE